MTAAICGTSFPLRRVRECPVCHQRRRIAGVDLGAWYGVRWTCCGPCRRFDSPTEVIRR